MSLCLCLSLSMSLSVCLSLLLCWSFELAACATATRYGMLILSQIVVFLPTPPRTVCHFSFLFLCLFSILLHLYLFLVFHVLSFFFFLFFSHQISVNFHVSPYGSSSFSDKIRTLRLLSLASFLCMPHLCTGILSTMSNICAISPLSAFFDISSACACLCLWFFFLFDLSSAQGRRPRRNLGGRSPKIGGGGRPMHPSPQYFEK